MRFPFKIYTCRWYWKIRKHLLLLAFYSRRLLFYRKQDIERTKHTLSISAALVSEIWKMFILSLLTVIAMEIFEKIILIKYASYLLQLFPDTLANVLNIIANKFSYDKDSYYTLLGTVAGMSGVFLGLYFTALSVVAQGLFQDIPDSIRNLVVKEKVGNTYVRTLAILSAISLLLLGYMSIGGQPGSINSFLVVFLSCYGVLSFVSLGIRVFYFFDIAKLVPSVFEDLQKSIKFATIEGFGWNDSSFQTKYKNDVVQCINTIQNISDRCINNYEHENHALKVVVSNTLHFVVVYQDYKTRIPTSSKLYIQTPRHENWFLADSTRISMAIETQTGIQPEYVQKSNWIEEEVASIYEKAIIQAISKNKLSDVYDFISYCSNSINGLGKYLDTTYAERLVGIIFSKSTTYLLSLEPISTNNLMKAENSELAILDQMGFMLIGLSISMVNSINIGCADNGIPQKVRDTDWTDASVIYKKQYPPTLLSQCEYVASRIAMEINSEGRQISPSWYISQIILMKYSEVCKNTLTSIINILSDRFVKLVKDFVSGQHYVYASQHASRGLELCEKMLFHLDKIEQSYKNLSQYHKISDLKWPDWKLEDFSKKLDETRTDLIILISQTLPFLAILERIDEVPDYFGQSYNTVYSQVHYALQENDSNQFGKIFSPFFISAMQAYDKLRKHPKLQNQDPMTMIGYSTEPLVDLIEVSGYAEIYSELNQNPTLWEACKKIWDKYFDALSDGKEMVKMIVFIDHARKSAFRIFPRDVLRTNWEMQLNGRFRKMNLMDDPGSRGWYPDESKRIDHPSPLIRVLCRDRFHSMISASEIFILSYLKSRPEAEGIDFNDRFEFLRDLEKEKRDEHISGDSNEQEI